MTQQTDVLDRNRITESPALAERPATINEQNAAIAERVANAQPVNDAKTLAALEAAQGFAVPTSDYTIPTGEAPVAPPQAVAEPAPETAEAAPPVVTFEALAVCGGALEKLRIDRVGRANAGLS